MNSKGKSIWIRAVGICGILIAIALFVILLYMNKLYKEKFTLAYNLFLSLYLVLLFISFAGLIFLKAWARILIIIISLVKMTDSIFRTANYFLYDLSRLKSLHILEQVTNIVIYALLIFFLTRKSIKNQFLMKHANPDSFH